MLALNTLHRTRIPTLVELLWSIHTVLLSAQAQHLILTVHRILTHMGLQLEAKHRIQILTRQLDQAAQAHMVQHLHWDHQERQARILKDTALLSMWRNLICLRKSFNAQIFKY
jgi:hypothetical protein